jgi:hypothetical protein
VPYRNTLLRPSPDAVFRRLPEWGRCLVYTAANPEVYELNPSAWLIVELCGAKPDEEVEAEFVSIIGRRVGPAKARQQFSEGLDTLLDLGILERAPPPLEGNLVN